MRELWAAVPCVSRSMASLWPACVVLLKMMLVLGSCSHVSGAQRETTKLRQYVGGTVPASVGAANGSPNGVGSSSGGGGSNTNGVTGAASNSFTGIGSSSRSSGGSSIGSSSTNNNLDLIDEQSRMSSAASAAAAASSPNGPFFDKMASKNITALLGKTTYLNCRIKNLGNKTTAMQVSWVRHRDIHLLTVGRYTYTSDQRFRAIHHQHSEDWMLQIKYPQHRDSGVYECQVSTTPHMSHFIHLNVIEPSTEIIGAPDLYIESGSTINLTCVILNSPEPPAYIFWNHNSAIITYESPRGGVSVLTKREETSTSFLLITNARTSDSGQYTCNPSNSKPKTVTVHVLNGEFPAAMQRAGQPHHRIPSRHGALVTVCAICSTWLLLWLSSLTGTARGIRKDIGSGRRGCQSSSSSSSILALQSALPGSVC